MNEEGWKDTFHVYKEHMLEELKNYEEEISGFIFIHNLIKEGYQYIFKQKVNWLLEIGNKEINNKNTLLELKKLSQELGAKIKEREEINEDFKNLLIEKYKVLNDLALKINTIYVQMELMGKEIDDIKSKLWWLNKKLEEVGKDE